MPQISGAPTPKGTPPSLKVNLSPPYESSEHAYTVYTGLLTMTKTVRIAVIFVVSVMALFAIHKGARWGLRNYTTSLVKATQNSPLPEFELLDRQSRKVRKSDLLGKSVILHFFRSKCVGCVGEKGEIRRLEAELDPEKVVLLSVMMDEVVGYSADVTEKTLSEFAFRHPVVMADEAFVEAFHGIGWAHITPIVYIADAKGVIKTSFRHPYSISDLRLAIE